MHVPDPGKNEPNELQCAELPSGEILLNVRSGNHPMRALSSSTDAGTRVQSRSTCLLPSG